MLREAVSYLSKSQLYSNDNCSSIVTGKFLVQRFVCFMRVSYTTTHFSGDPMKLHLTSLQRTSLYSFHGYARSPSTTASSYSSVSTRTPGEANTIKAALLVPSLDCNDVRSFLKDCTSHLSKTQFFKTRKQKYRVRLSHLKVERKVDFLCANAE